jgi:hypothetical protein
VCGRGVSSDDGLKHSWEWNVLGEQGALLIEVGWEMSSEPLALRDNLGVVGLEKVGMQDVASNDKHLGGVAEQ